MLGREERFKMLLGGSGVGKTCLGAMEGLCELFIPGRKIAIIGAVYKHVLLEAELIYKGFLTLFPPSAATVKRFRDQKNYTEFQIDTIWGSSIRGYSLDYNEGAQVLGEGYDLVICAEADLIPNYVLNRRVKRALDRRAQRTSKGYQHKTGRIVMYTTPHFGEGAASEEYTRIMEQTEDQPEKLQVDRVPWPSSAYVRTAGVLENPSYDPAIYEARKAELLRTDPDAFYEQYHGQIRRRTGLVLDTFDRTRHVIEMPSVEKLRKMRFGIGIDTGNNFAAVLCGIDPERKKYVLGSLARTRNEGHIFDHVQATKEMVANILGPVFGTSGDYNNVNPLVDAIYVDYRSQHKPEMETAFNCPMDYQDLPQAGSYDQLRHMLENDELFVVDSAKQWIDSVNKCFWKEQSSTGVRTGKITKGADHLFDATRFILIGYLEVMGPRPESIRPLSAAEAYDRQLRRELDWKTHYRQQLHDDWYEEINGDY